MKKSVVFFCNDSSERHAAENLARSFEARGFETTFSSSLLRIATIGIYFGDKQVPGLQLLTARAVNGLDSDHVFPEDASPFFIEGNWAKFDLGLLPTKRWADRFFSGELVNQYSPKLGVEIVGWPKLDSITTVTPRPRPSKIVVLYAPQMEDGFKQQEVSDACKSLGFELIVKHWETKTSSGVAGSVPYLRIINDANEYTNRSLASSATIANPDSNITLSLSKANILVTDQTSIIYEAGAMGIPSVTVDGWKHWCGDCRGSVSADRVLISAKPGELVNTLRRVGEDLREFQVTTLGKIAVEFVFLGTAATRTVNVITNKLEEIKLRQVLPRMLIRLPTLLLQETMDQLRRIYWVAIAPNYEVAKSFWRSAKR